MRRTPGEHYHITTVAFYSFDTLSPCPLLPFFLFLSPPFPPPLPPLLSQVDTCVRSHPLSGPAPPFVGRLLSTALRLPQEIVQVHTQIVLASVERFGSCTTIFRFGCLKARAIVLSYWPLDGWCSLPQVHRGILLSLTHTHTHSSCMSDPLPEIQCLVQRLSDSFLKAAPQVSHLSTPKKGTSYLTLCSFSHLHLRYTIFFSFQKVGPIPNQFPELRLHLSVSLYYKLLGAIIHDEESKNVDFGQLQACAYQTLSNSQFISLCVSIADNAGV